MTTADSILAALKKFDRLGGHGNAIIVKRTDHPHIDGDYYYAIRPADKHAWTAGEAALTSDAIAALWYAAECPTFRPERTYYPELANLAFVLPCGHPAADLTSADGYTFCAVCAVAPVSA